MTEEKVELVKEYKDEYGLNTCLDVIELPKSTWYYQTKEKVAYEEKYKELKGAVLDVISGNPGYGYRRILPELHDRGYEVGEFVLRRMLKRWDLGVVRTIRKPRLSGPRRYLHGGSKGWNLVKNIDDPQALQVLYTDFTEIWYDGKNKKAYLMPIIDHKTRLVVGWEVAERKNTDLALGALGMTRTNLEGMGKSLEGSIIHHDQDTVYTGYRWLQAVLIKERAKISFSENGALGYLAPWAYIKQEVTLPDPALDLAQISA